MISNDILKILWDIEPPYTEVHQSINPILKKSALDSWIKNFGKDFVQKTFFWEYHKFTKGVSGQPPKGSYKDFEEELFNGSLANKIKLDYPVLTKIYLDQITKIRKQVCLIDERLKRDKELLEVHFNQSLPLGELMACEWGLSDSHCGGQKVHILHFEKLKIVYKPRSLYPDLCFQEYLSYINVRSHTNPHKILKILDRKDYQENQGEYGWIEFVSFEATDDKHLLDKYYYRFGSLLAILYSLGAVDFHYENLIAQGEYPILIDLESCLQPKVKTDSLKKKSNPESSVLDTAMLPSRLWNAEDSIDISALSAKDGDFLLGLTEEIIGFQEEDLKLIKIKSKSKNRKNSPVKNNLSPWLWKQEIQKGFCQTYEIIFQNRKYLLSSEESPLKDLLKSNIRYFPRNTITYYTMSKGCFHPLLLSSEESWSQHFNWLKDNPSYLGSFISEAEINSLKRGDIPYFFVSGCDLGLNWKGDQGIQNWPLVFEASPSQQVRNRLEIKMSAQDLERQKWFIETSLQLLSKETLTHKIKLSETESLFSLFKTLASVNKDELIFLQLKPFSEQFVISKMNEQDMEELFLIEKSLTYYYQVNRDPESYSLLTKHQKFLQKLFPLITHTDNSKISNFLQSHLFKKVESLDFMKSNSEILEVDIHWIKKIDDLISQSLEKNERASEYLSTNKILDSIFNKEISIQFKTEKGVMTSSFYNGISGLLYLSCRYKNPSLPSLFERSL